MFSFFNVIGRLTYLTKQNFVYLILLLRQIEKTDLFVSLSLSLYLSFVNGSSSSIESDDDVCGQCLKSYSFSLIEFVTYLTQ